MKLSPQVVPVLLAVFSAVANAQDNDTEQEYCGCKTGSLSLHIFY
jgi:hypothetical protein